MLRREWCCQVGGYVVLTECGESESRDRQSSQLKFSTVNFLLEYDMRPMTLIDYYSVDDVLATLLLPMTAV